LNDIAVGQAQTGVVVSQYQAMSQNWYRKFFDIVGSRVIATSGSGESPDRPR
jgi:hypothetical protein